MSHTVPTQFKDHHMVEVNEKCPTQHKNTPSRSTTASRAAAFVSERMKHHESNVAVIHPSIVPTCAV